MRCENRCGQQTDRKNIQRGPRGRNGRPGPPGPEGPQGPQGEQGPAGGTDQFLSTFSTPPQVGTSELALIFDRNGAVSGEAILHEKNSPDITIRQPGTYYVSFHGSVTPEAEAGFPLSVRLFLTSHGATVSGASAVQTFTIRGVTAGMAFSQIVEVSSAPAVLRVESQRGGFLYGEINLSVIKIH